ncbi:MAG: HU family DNA-binding protein [Desulfatiglandales bacterium]
MTVTKTDLIKSVMDKVRLKRHKRDRQRFLFPEFDYEPLTKQQATRLVESTFEIIKNKLEKGEQVLISRFGKFKVKFKWARKGRNPKTGEQIILDSRRIVNFQASQKLKDKLNRG